MKAIPWECQRDGISPQAIGGVKDLLRGWENLGTGSGKVGNLLARHCGKGAERDGTLGDLRSETVGSVFKHLEVG